MSQARNHTWRRRPLRPTVGPIGHNRFGVQLLRHLPLLLLLLFSVAGTGCPSSMTRFESGMAAEDRARAATLPLYRESLPTGRYEIVGPVRGLSCQITHDDRYRVSEDNALEELKRTTLRAGGDAVIDVRCQSFERGRGPRSCFRSIECRGNAIRSGQQT